MFDKKTILKYLVASLSLLLTALPARSEQAINFQITNAALASIAERIYQNECGSDPDKLVWWNQGESFPSLGIGHFIWFPAQVQEPFEESFPSVLKRMRDENIAMPKLLQSAHAPWENREQYIAASSSVELNELKEFLVNTQPIQAAYIFERAQQSWNKIIEQADASEKAPLQNKIQSLLNESGGAYALIDYVNFKGDGLKTSERYNGQGWGLYQVLIAMQPGEPALQKFQLAAKKMLRRRANNATRAIEKETWLPGWEKRLDTYMADSIAK